MRNPVASTPTDWSSFGGFVSGTVGTLLSAVNLALLAHISVNIARAAKSREEDIARTRLLFELERNWHDLNDERTKSDALIQKHPFASLTELHDMHPGESDSIWRVLGFFKSLSFAVETGVLNTTEAIVVFGQIFIWWDVVCIKIDYPSFWDSYGRLKRLREKVSRSQHYQEWVDYAKKDLERYQSAFWK